MTSSVFKLKPIPDETIFGLLFQIGTLKGAKTYAECERLVFGDTTKMRYGTGDASPECMEKLLQFVDVGNLEQLLEGHSFWPYWAAFQNVSSSLVLELGKNVGNLRTVLGLAGTQAVKETKTPKYCKACATEQILNYSRTTWLRSHQLPGVMVCHTHGITLSESNLLLDRSTRGTQEINFPIPAEVLLDVGTETKLQEEWDVRNPYLLWAQISRACLYSNGLFSDEQSTLNLYQAELFARGLLTTERSDWDGIEMLVRRRFGDIFLKQVGLDVFGNKGAPWFKKLLMEQEYFRQPARHLLLIGALFDKLPSASDMDRAKLATALELPRKTLQASVPVKLAERDRREMREQVMRALAENPALTRLQLRKKLGRWSHQWLLRNDGDWLDTQIDKRICKRSYEIADWQARAATLVSAVKCLADEQKKNLFAQGKLNRAELSRQVKTSSRMIKNLVRRVDVTVRLAELCSDVS
jgi:hypothetical protein